MFNLEFYQIVRHVKYTNVTLALGHEPFEYVEQEIDRTTDFLGGYESTFYPTEDTTFEVEGVEHDVMYIVHCADETIKVYVPPKRIIVNDLEVVNAEEELLQLANERMAEKMMEKPIDDLTLWEKIKELFSPR